MKATLQPNHPALSPLTASQLRSKVSPQGQAVVESWAESNPAQVKKWQVDGSLVQRAQEAGQQAQQAQEKAMANGDNHLAPHEINEIYGGPSLNLAE